MDDLTKCIYLFCFGEFGKAARKLSGKPGIRNKCLTDALRFMRKYKYESQEEDSQRTNRNSQ
jgi:hypothetical protein